MKKSMKLVKSKSGGRLMASIILSDDDGERHVWDQSFDNEKDMMKRIKEKIKYFEKGLNVKVDE